MIKGKNYSYMENVYITKNYPYIPVYIECSWSEYDRANKLCLDGTIGICDMSDKKDYVKGYCLVKDLDKVSKILNFTSNIVGKEGNEYLDWLHDTLCDEFGDIIADGNRSRFGFINDMREKNRHKVIHFIIDNINKYYGYFINCDTEYEWLYWLYNNARDGIVDESYNV